MRRLFNEDGFYTQEANNLSNEVQELLTKFLDQNPDVDPNDVISVVHRAVHPPLTKYHMQLFINNRSKEEGDQ